MRIERNKFDRPTNKKMPTTFVSKANNPLNITQPTRPTPPIKPTISKVAKMSPEYLDASQLQPKQPKTPKQDKINMLLDTSIKQNVSPQQPLINIITRTHNRPNGFAKLIQSIREQSYRNIKHYVTVDDWKKSSYVRDYDDIEIVDIDKVSVSKEPDIPNPATGGRFIYNLYLNKAISQINEGWILILDDDDCFTSNTSLSEMVSQITDNMDMVLFQMKYPSGAVLPAPQNMRKSPQLGRIGMPCVLAHNSIVKQVKFDGWKCGDFRYILKLYNLTNAKKWIDKPLIQLGNNGGQGRGQDIQFKINSQPFIPTVPKKVMPVLVENDDTIYIISVGWNCAPYIDETVKCLQNQTNRNWICYMLDDKSTDNTWDKMTKITDPRIRVFRNDQNMGAAYSRMRLIKMLPCKDNVVGVLDLDDTLHSQALERVYNLYKNPEIKMSFGRYLAMYGNSPKNEFFTKIEIDTQKIGNNRLFLCPPFRTFRYTLTNEIGFEDMKDESGKFYQTCTDVVLVFNLLKQVKYQNVHLFKEVMYYHRNNRKDSSLNKFGGQNKRKIFENLLRKYYG